MMKFKTLFRKGHSSSSNANIYKNKNATDNVKSSHTAATRNSNDSDDNGFENQVATSDDDCTNVNKLGMETDQYSERGIDVMTNVEQLEKDEEFEKMKLQFEAVLKEKANLEADLQALIKSHGELESLNEEIEALKVTISVNKSIRLVFLTVYL